MQITKFFPFSFAVSVCVMLPVTTRAVVVATGDGTQNATSTGAGAGWNYVSGFSNINGPASAIYLGNYGGEFWAIRARHTSTPNDGTLNFNGVGVNRIADTDVRVLNDPNDPTSGTDLVLFRVDTDPGLPPLNLIKDPLTVGASLRLIGNGRNRETTLTRWTSTWTETANPIAPNVGYKWAAGNTKRWGNNNLESFATAVVVPGQGEVDYFLMDYDNTADEGMGAVGDSGGGVFYYDPIQEEWYLTGVMLAIYTFEGQPANSSVFGNATAAADISQYRDFILQTIPEPSTALLALIGLAAVLLGSPLRLLRLNCW